MIAIKNILLPLASAFIGWVGFTTLPQAAALILAVPVFWTLAEMRYTAFAVVLAYKLAASRGLLPGAAVFLSEDHTLPEAAALYFLMFFGASLPFLVFWSKDEVTKALCLSAAFIVAYVLPPISLIGIINPLIASGVIFRGWGIFGIFAMLAVYALCAVSRKGAYVSICIIALFTALPDCWYEPTKPLGVTGIDTSFGRLGSGSFNFFQDYERANWVFDTLKQSNLKYSEAQIIVLPETIAGRLNNTGLKLWREKIKTLLPGKAVIFGAELPADDGRKYDNAVILLHGEETSVAYQRIPVPYSMYNGPFAETGARLHLWNDGILELPDGRKAAVIICYETFLTWPFLASMTRSPDLIICAANLWWCRDTSLPPAQQRIIGLWALTFGVPVVSARNM